MALSCALPAAITPVVHAAPISDDDAYRYIRQFEGFVPWPYRDGDQWCIGVGHVLTAPLQQVYSTDQLYAWFDEDLWVARRVCRRTITDFDGLPEPAQAIALSLVFSVGPSGFVKFRNFRSALSKQKFRRAALALKDSLWWGQVGLNRAEDAYQRLWRLD